MKKLAGILALTMIVSASQAQDKQESRHHHKHHDKQMLEKQLNFSEDQKKKLKDINADYKNQMAELRKNDNITVKELKSRKETIRKERTQKVKGLLTSEQKSQLEKMKQDRMAKHEARGKAGLEKMKSKLNLTDEQASKLKASHESFASKAKEIRSNQTLSDQEKKAEFKALAEQRKEETKSILTKDQFEKLQQMHKGRQERSVK